LDPYKGKADLLGQLFSYSLLPLLISPDSQTAFPVPKMSFLQKTTEPSAKARLSTNIQVYPKPLFATIAYQAKQKTFDCRNIAKFMKFPTKTSKTIEKNSL